VEDSGGRLGRWRTVEEAGGRFMKMYEGRGRWQKVYGMFQVK
jgi:hypothetical protein